MNQSKLMLILGAVGVVAGFVVVADFGPMASKIAGVVASSATGIGVLMARQHNMTSTDAGAVDQVPPSPAAIATEEKKP